MQSNAETCGVPTQAVRQLREDYGNALRRRLGRSFDHLVGRARSDGGTVMSAVAFTFLHIGISLAGVTPRFRKPAHHPPLAIARGYGRHVLRPPVAPGLGFRSDPPAWHLLQLQRLQLLQWPVLPTLRLGRGLVSD